MENKQFDFKAGEILLFDKPLHWTSFDLVRKIRASVRRIIGEKNIKVGHAGTLDPMATGLMILCTGKKTKIIEQITASTKEYVAQIVFGATKPSYDNETEIDQHFPSEHITAELIRKTLDEHFSGEIDQLPPIFSAKKIDGKRAYELARKGSDVEMKTSRIHIYQTEIIALNENVLDLRVKCSKGTYIRSLAHDLGKALNSGAYLNALVRTRIGDYTLENAYSINNFRKIIGDDAINN